MKKLVFTLFISVCASALFAQDQSKPATDESPATATPANATPAKKQPTVTRQVAVRNFCCPSCDFVSTKPGNCPHHNKALIRDGMYYCEDGTTSREPGKCKDGKDMVKMVDKTVKTGGTKPAPETKPVPGAK